MKKLSILFLTVVALGMSIASCTKSDSTTTSSASIVGKWNFGTMSGTEGTTSVPAGTAESYYSDSNCTTPSYFQFDSTGGVQFGVYSSQASCAVTVYKGTYTMSSDKKTITIVTGSATLNLSVITLTATQFVFEDKGGSGSTAYDLIHTMSISK